MMTKKCFRESREGEKKKKYLFALEVEPLSSTQEEATNSSFESTSTAEVYAKAAAADAAALIAPHTFMMRTREKSNYLVPSNTLL